MNHAVVISKLGKTVSWKRGEQTEIVKALKRKSRPSIQPAFRSEFYVYKLQPTSPPVGGGLVFILSQLHDEGLRHSASKVHNMH